MGVFRLLLVEDSEQDRNVCRDTVDRYRDENHREIELVVCSNVDEAFDKIDNSFDGAIIDLRLADQGDEGNQVLSRIKRSHLRIPVAVLTGTPDAADSEFAYIGVFKKGEPGAGYADLLDRFWGIYDTGLTRIMGGRGIIEETLSKVFQKNLLPQRDKWVRYGEVDPSKTEKALLRHTLNHLLQLLADDVDKNFPEEVYLSPPLTDNIRIGSIVQEKNSKQKFVVMSPACDLVIRTNGKFNTDRILIIEIDSQELRFPGYSSAALSNTQKKELENAYKNNKLYYHWIPQTDFFEGGFLNFRKVLSLPLEEFNGRFEKPAIQISPSFVKDIVARFSAYYARQGQPEIDFEHFISPPEA